MLLALVCIVGFAAAISFGSTGSIESAELLLGIYSTVFLPLCIGGLVADHRKNHELKSNMLTRKNNLEQIAKKYNAVTGMLESSYKEEKRSLGFFSGGKKEKLRLEYEDKYNQNRKAFEMERDAFLKTFNSDTPTSVRFKKYWKKVIVAGILTQFVACGYTLGIMPSEDLETSTSTVSASTQSTTAWNAENIPMPHLTDGSRYVSNPDNVVTANTEQLLNRMLKKMDDSLKIESAMIIVNHVENEDVFRMAQDIFDKYKVGKDDRGMVIVLAYQDHKVRTHTGRKLEADLTDIECSRLQQTYAIPFMKSEQPDSGMLYLTEAIFKTLQKKELPLTWSQQKEAESDEAAGLLAIYLFILAGWCFLAAYLNHRYTGGNGLSLLRPNPFYKAPTVVVGGGSSRGGGFGGGGFSGGGFSGGSSGGGGATSSW